MVEPTLPDPRHLPGGGPSGAPGTAGASLAARLGGTGGLSRFGQYIRTGVSIVRLETDVALAASRDPAGVIPGLCIVAIGGAAQAAGRLKYLELFVHAVAAVLGSIVILGLLHLLAKVVFNGKATFREFYVPNALASVVTWPAAIPLLGPLWYPAACFWYAVVMIFVLRRIHGLAMVPSLLVLGILILLSFFAIMVMVLSGILVASSILGWSVFRSH